MSFSAALLALAFDAFAGDPPALYRRVPHPVALLGGLVARAERLLDPLPAGAGYRACSGAALVVIVIALAALLAGAATWALRLLPGGWLLEGVLASTLLAFRGLHEHVDTVARALAGPSAGRLHAARVAVAHIVGRDPRALDEAGIARASIESLAENWSDGVVAPLLWYVALGLPGLAAYKAINTLDSMVGYRDARYAALGRCAARLDDIVNWPASRLASVLLALAAVVVPGASACGAARAVCRDARQHRSPNAGWPEAAMAGALGFRLAGPRVYAGRRVEDAWMGSGRKDLAAADVHAALAVYRVAGAMAGCVLAAGALLFG